MGAGWLMALCLAATDLQLEAFVRNEDRAGVLATGPATASVVAADLELFPRLRLGLATGQTLTTLSYGPRLFYRVPNPLAQRPLILHQAELELVARLSPLATLTATAFLNAGEVDYSRALLVFDARTQTPASLPNAGIIRFLNTGAVTTLERALSEQERLAGGLQLSTSRPLGGMGPATYPIQNRVELTAEYARALGARDELQGTLGVGETWYLPGPAYTSLTPLTGWRRLLDAHQELRLRLGALVAATTGYASRSGPGTTVSVPRGLRLLPIADGTYSYQGRPARLSTLRGEVSAGMAGYFEPVRAIVVPRGFVSLRGELVISAATQLRAFAALYAPIDRGSTTAAAGADPFPSAVFADTVWRQVWSARITSEVGVRGSSRASRLTARRLRTNQPELVGFVAVIASAELLD